MDTGAQREWAPSSKRRGGNGSPLSGTNLDWTYQTAPGRTAGTVETKDVDFGGTS